jgi:hypothetical protein
VYLALIAAALAGFPIFVSARWVPRLTFARYASESTTCKQLIKCGSQRSEKGILVPEENLQVRPLVDDGLDPSFGTPNMMSSNSREA